MFFVGKGGSGFFLGGTWGSGFSRVDMCSVTVGALRVKKYFPFPSASMSRYTHSFIVTKSDEKNDRKKMACDRTSQL